MRLNETVIKGGGASNIMARTTRSSSRRGRSLTVSRSRARSESPVIKAPPTLIIRIRDKYIVPFLTQAWRISLKHC